MLRRWNTLPLIVVSITVSITVSVSVSLVACRGGKSQKAGPAGPKGGINRELVPIEEPIFVDHSALGTKLDQGGNVAATQGLTFEQGERIYLTMWLQLSPSGLETRAHWTDTSGHEIAPDAPKKMNGEKIVTFPLSKLPGPGKYHVIGYWGGNIAAEYDFEVTAKKGKKGRPR